MTYSVVKKRVYRTFEGMNLTDKEKTKIWYLIQGIKNNAYTYGYNKGKERAFILIGRQRK